mmetsp:Transcript_10024/g.15161  ORF Transcript_10024/g.15161 Transcript_10024/m.15161 type:complete len:381 (+) Transcript_10024:52-1194(+)
MLSNLIYILLALFILSIENVVSERMCVLSTVDSHGLVSEIVKVHSIIESTRNKADLFFGFATKDQTNKQILETALKGCFGNISAEVKILNQPPTFKKYVAPNRPVTQLARVILPEHFPQCEKFIYIDSDAIGNIDIEEVLSFPLKRMNAEGRMEDVHSGYIFDSCHSNYIHTQRQFNMSHPDVIDMFAANKGFYINAGVWMCNSNLWIKQNVTGQMLEFMERTSVEPLFIKPWDDQSLAYMVSGKNAAKLPNTFNMRRLCKHTVSNFDNGARGFVHFAGTSAKHCNIVSYPAFAGAAGYFAGVALSLSRKCNISPQMYSQCEKHIRLVERINAKLNLTDSRRIDVYKQVDPGYGNFTWPGLMNFTFLEPVLGRFHEKLGS